LLLHDDFFLKVDVGAGIAVKLSATSRSDFSSLLNLVAVVDVIKRNRPLPTTDAEMNAFLSLSLIAGVSVVNDDCTIRSELGVR
jgi:hypothetical protein